MDNYSEQLISKVPTTKDKAKIALIIIAVIVVVAVAVVILVGFAPFNIVIAAGAIYGGYVLISNTNIEYEYIITNKDMDIDKVIAKRKRKRLVSVNIPTFESFGKLSEAAQPKQDVTTVLASANNGEEDYYADFKHPQLGDVRLIFTPNQKTIDTLKPALPRTIKYNINKI